LSEAQQPHLSDPSLLAYPRDTFGVVPVETKRRGRQGGSKRKRKGRERGKKKKALASVICLWASFLSILRSRLPRDDLGADSAGERIGRKGKKKGGEKKEAINLPLIYLSINFFLVVYAYLALTARKWEG